MFIVNTLINKIIMRYLLKTLTWIDKVKKMIKHQYVTAILSQYISRRQQTEIYVYMYKSKNEIPVTVFVADVQYHSHLKLQLQIWYGTSNKIYFKISFLHTLHPPEFIKTFNLYTTKSRFFAIKVACYIIGTI